MKRIALAATTTPSRIRKAASDAASTGRATRSRRVRRISASVGVLRLEGERHAERAGHLGLQHDLQRVTRLVRAGDGGFARRGRGVERNVERANRVDCFLKLRLEPRGDRPVDLAQVIVEADAGAA